MKNARPCALRPVVCWLGEEKVWLIVAPAVTDVAGPRITIRPVAGLPLLHVEEPEFTGVRRVLKGTIDRFGGSFVDLYTAQPFDLDGAPATGVAFDVRIYDDDDFQIEGLFTHQGGIYWRWLGNSFLYAFVGGAGATVLSILAGYGFAKYRFRGRGTVFGVILGSIMVPLTALVVPTFMLLSQYGLINTPWAVILPSLLSPFGVYLMRVYTQDAVPDEMLEAARIDGAGEWRTFFQVALPLLKPAIVTVLLLSVVGTWNNFFLPLAVLTDPQLLPVTVGLNRWTALSNAGAGGEQVWNLITSGAFISVVPLILSFLFLQRYWQGGLAIGSVK